jgi:hypothetical protein
MIVSGTEVPMTIAKWEPRRAYLSVEKVLLKRLTRVRKLFGFLREVRDELFDEEFQRELEAMYHDTGAGKPAVPPALMAMAVLLQCYVGASDAEAIELTVVALRWQIFLDRLGATEPPFSQAALHDFRHRLIRSDMDRRLLERTVQFARRTGGSRLDEAFKLIAALWLRGMSHHLLKCVVQRTIESTDLVAPAGPDVRIHDANRRTLDRDHQRHELDN